MPAELMAQLRVTTTFATRWSLKSGSEGFTLLAENPDSSVVPGAHNWLAFTCVGAPRRVVMGAYFMPADSTSTSGLGSTPQTFAPLVTGYSLTGFNGRAAAPQDRSQALTLAPAEIHQRARVAGANHVSAFVAISPRVVELMRRADLLTFNFELGLSFPGRVSVDLATGRDQVMSFVSNCR